MSLRKPNDYVALDQADLVRLAQAGDREAFRVIMQQGNQRLFRMARGVVRDDAEAEDVLQETLLALHLSRRPPHPAVGQRGRHRRRPR